MMKERKSEMGESLEHMNMLGHFKEHHVHLPMSSIESTRVNQERHVFLDWHENSSIEIGKTSIKFDYWSTSITQNQSEVDRWPMRWKRKLSTKVTTTTTKNEAANFRHKKKEISFLFRSTLSSLNEQSKIGSASNQATRYSRMQCLYR